MRNIADGSGPGPCRKGAGPGAGKGRRGITWWGRFLLPLALALTLPSCATTPYGGYDYYPYDSYYTPYDSSYPYGSTYPYYYSPYYYYPQGYYYRPFVHKHVVPKSKTIIVPKKFDDRGRRHEFRGRDDDRGRGRGRDGGGRRGRDGGGRGRH